MLAINLLPRHPSPKKSRQHQERRQQGGAEETLTSPQSFFAVTSIEPETLRKFQGIPSTFGVFPCQESEVIPRAEAAWQRLAAQMLSEAFTSRSCCVPQPPGIQTLHSRHFFPVSKGRRAQIRHGDFLLLQHNFLLLHCGKEFTLHGTFSRAQQSHVLAHRM